MKLHSCSCGGLKFRTTYSKAYCTICGKVQEGIVCGHTLTIKIPAPEIEQVVVLSNRLKDRSVPCE